MQVLGERSSNGSTDSGAPTDSDAFGLPTHPGESRSGRRRGARVRARAFSARSRRDRRRAWDVDALRLPDPLLTAPMAVDDALLTAGGSTRPVPEPVFPPLPRSSRPSVTSGPSDLSEQGKNEGKKENKDEDGDATAEWQDRPVHAIDLSDHPRLIVRPDLEVTPEVEVRPGPKPGAPKPGAPKSGAPKSGVPKLPVPKTLAQQPNAPVDFTPIPGFPMPASDRLAIPAVPAVPAVLALPAAAVGPAAVEPVTPEGAARDRAATNGTRAPAFSSGRDQLPDPVHLATEPSRLPEALLTAVLAIVAGLAAWGTAAPPEAWIPLAAVPAAGLIALLLPGGSWARVARAGALLAAAATLPVLAPAMTPVTLVVALSVAAVYPMLVGPPAGRTITLLAIGSLAAPLMVAALTDGPTDFLHFLLAADGDPTTAVRLALGSGMLVVALVGGSTMATRRTLTRTASLAVTRERTARAATARLGVAVSHDAATGLPNREALLRALTIALAGGDRSRHPSAGLFAGPPGVPAEPTGPVGLLIVDIERFAALTDSLGSSVADAVAEQVADRLRTLHPAPAFLARVSRHQFALLLTDATGDSCARTAREITAAMAMPVGIGDRDLAVSCAMGSALAGPGLRTAAELLQAGDEAARAAQRSGRSRWVMFDQAVRAHALSQATLEIELRDAVRRGAIEVAFQPVLAFGTDDGSTDRSADRCTGRQTAPGPDDRIVGAEVLARWTRIDGTAVEPQRFIPMADELGLGVDLGMQVIRQSLEALLSWRHKGVDIDQVWVNLAASQLEDPEFAHEVAAQLAIRGLASSSLVLEISAGRLVESEQCLSTLGMLRSLGIAVALDDFGRAGTSLTALRRLPISAVKLDPSLAAELGRQDAVPRAMAQLCRALGLRVVVEGVETMVQLNGAREIGADAVQGFAIARPMSAEDITNLLTLRLPRDFRL